MGEHARDARVKARTRRVYDDGTRPGECGDLVETGLDLTGLEGGMGDAVGLGRFPRIDDRPLHHLKPPEPLAAVGKVQADGTDPAVEVDERGGGLGECCGNGVVEHQRAWRIRLKKGVWRQRVGDGTEPLLKARCAPHLFNRSRGDVGHPLMHPPDDTDDTVRGR